jgi:hypothetical protein
MANAGEDTAIGAGAHYRWGCKVQRSSADSTRENMSPWEGPHGRVPTMMLPFEWKPGPH